MADDNPKILCVDDETSVLMSLKRLIARESWDVAVAEGGEDALKVLDKR